MPAPGRVARLAPFLLLPWTWFLVRDLHPATDVVALGLPVLVVACVVAGVGVAALRRRRAPLLTAGSWLAFGVVAVAGPWVPDPGPAPVDAMRVVAANVHGNAGSGPTLLAELDAQAADVLVVSELGSRLAETLPDDFATVLWSRPRPGRVWSGVALATDLPARDLGLPEGLGDVEGLRARVEGPGGTVVVYALHLPPPRARPAGDWEVSVRRHRRLVARVRDAVAAEELPVVVAGDLNLVDRAWGYRALTGVLDDAMRSTWLRPTARRPGTLHLLGRVDHVLVSERWCSADAAVVALTGSDHRGVATSVGPCSPP
jgi:endonuclease/exonuclease/phosphatase (EEP) superfamily protein YafD